MLLTVLRYKYHRSKPLQEVQLEDFKERVNVFNRIKRIVKNNLITCRNLNTSISKVGRK